MGLMACVLWRPWQDAQQVAADGDGQTGNGPRAQGYSGTMHCTSAGAGELGILQHGRGACVAVRHVCTLTPRPGRLSDRRVALGRVSSAWARHESVGSAMTVLSLPGLLVPLAEPGWWVLLFGFARISWTFSSTVAGGCP